MSYKIDYFVETLLPTNKNYTYFVNWQNVKLPEQLEVEFNALNSLISKTNNFDDSFIALLSKLPSVVQTFPFLLALSKQDREHLLNRQTKLEIFDNENQVVNDLEFFVAQDKLSFDEIKKYLDFFKKTGLRNLFTDILKRNVIDYLTGTLVGLDTHGRKNRSGQNFQVLCENLIISVASKYNLTFYKQVRFKDIESNNLKFTDGLYNKIADIVLVKNGKALNIELNYFETGGSKPNEIIESYINRKNELHATGHYFILISDGLAWKQNSHNQLIKAFDNIEIVNYHIAKSREFEEKIKRIFDVNESVTK